MDRTGQNAGPNPPIQLLRTIAQTKNGVWKAGAFRDVFSVKVTAHAAKTRNAPMA
jgi:hypothetical protein